MDRNSAKNRITGKPLLTLLNQNDLDTLRLTADDFDDLLLNKLERCDAQKQQVNQTIEDNPFTAA